MRPTWGQVREFCRVQGYRETRTDHYRYVKVLPDRSTSGTMVSFAADGEQLFAQRWRLVWRHQLRLAHEDEFWNGLRGEPVQYAIPPPSQPSTPLPDYLHRFLETTLHYSEAQIAVTTREESQQFRNEHYARDLLEL